MPRPTRAAAIEFLNAWSQRTGVDLGLAPKTVAERLHGISFAELEEFALDVQRCSILSGPEPQAREVTQRVLKEWANRSRTSVK